MSVRLRLVVFGALALGALALILGLASAPAEAAKARGLTVELKASEAQGAPVAEEIELYGASYALVVGIDAYTGGWPRLSNAVKDAKLVAAELEKAGFQVTLKTDLNSAELKRVFEEFFIDKGADPEARLFVWYAGHGHTLGGEGYLVPADAPRPKDLKRFKLKALNMRRFGEFVRQAEAKHAFAVFDSCFSGTVFESARALPPSAVTRATTLPVRQFLTSGDAGQTVSDDGTFRELFLRALRGEERADANGDGYVTAREIGLFLADRVTNLTRSKQTPRYGKLRDKDWDRGDFVFALAGQARKKLPVQATVRRPATGGTSAEVAFWQSIQGSKDPDTFQAYLDQYPNGAFAGLARLKIRKLKDQPKVAALTPATLEIEEMDATYVAVKSANLRAEPSAQSGRVGRLAVDSGVAVTGRVKGKNWYRVAHAGKTAYVFASLVKAVEAGEVTAWGNVKDSKQAGDFEAFLKAHPKGHFTARAKTLLAALTPPRAKPAAPKQPRAARKTDAVIQEALRIVRTLPKDKRKDPLEKIAEAQAWTGNEKWAFHTAGRISGDDMKIGFLLIVRGQLGAGNLAGALRTMEAMPDDWPRGYALQDITGAYAKAGNLKAAKQTAQKIKAELTRSIALEYVSKAEAKAGLTEESTRTALSIPHQNWRIRTLGYVALAQHKAGAAKSSEETFSLAIDAALAVEKVEERIKGLHAVASSLGKAGDVPGAKRLIEAAVKLVEGLPEKDRDFQVYNIVRSLAEFKDFDGAFATASKIKGEGLASSALRQIAEFLAKAGEFDRAFDTASDLSENDDRVSALQAIASALAKEGDIERAKRTFADAASAAFEISKESSRASYLRSVAEAQALAGDYDGALKVARRITVDHFRAEALARIVVADTKYRKETVAAAKKPKTKVASLTPPKAKPAPPKRSRAAKKTDAVIQEALRIVRTLPKDKRWYAMLHITKAQAWTGDEKGAFHTAGRLPIHEKKFGLPWVIQGQLGAGNLAGAVRTMEMPGNWNREDAFYQIALAYAKAGDMKAAKQTARRINGKFVRSGALEYVSKAEAKAGHTEESTRTALSIPYQPDRIQTLGYVALAQHKAGAAKSSEDTFSLAIDAALAVEKVKERIKALYKVASSLGKAGDAAGAKRLIATAVKLVEELPEKDQESPLFLIALSQAEFKDFDGAFATASKMIESEQIRRVIVEYLAKAGEFDRAFETASGISEKKERSWALSSVAEFLAKAGEFDRAFETASGISTKGGRAKALREIATALAKTGDIERAKRTFAVAAKAAFEISDTDSQNFILRTIAEAQAKAGDFDGALKLARRIEVDHFRAEALARIVVADAKHRKEIAAAAK